MTKSFKNLIGLTGGIASGKSIVAKKLSELGAKVIDADQIARELVSPGTSYYKKIISAFGTAVLDQNSSSEPKAIDRKKLRSIVFNDAHELIKLNAILEKAIVDKAISKYKSLNKKHPNSIFIYDAATLFEADADKHCHKIIVVYIPADKQEKRLVERDLCPKNEAKSIIKLQIPIEEKRKKADFVIDNSTDIFYTLEQVEKIYQELKIL